LNARRLIVRDGGAIVASTLGAGQGGNVTVTASESVEIVGTTREGFPSVIATASGDLPPEFFRAATCIWCGGKLEHCDGPVECPRRRSG
jgi:hypothetical protein